MKAITTLPRKFLKICSLYMTVLHPSAPERGMNLIPFMLTGILTIIIHDGLAIPKKPIEELKRLKSTWTHPFSITKFLSHGNLGAV